MVGGKGGWTERDNRDGTAVLKKYEHAWPFANRDMISCTYAVARKQIVDNTVPDKYDCAASKLQELFDTD